MKVLIVSQWFDPEPTFKGLMFAKALVAAGHEVDVITGFPNYPGGKVYDGYKVRLLQREVMDGVRITRVPLYPSHDGSAMRRVANYASYAASATLYGIFGAGRADVIYAYHPPLTVGMAASLIGMFRRTPVVCDIQDMWPDTLRATGMLNSERALNVVSKFCDWVYRRAARVVVLSPGFQRLLQERGVPAGKLDVIYNWCDETGLTQAAARPAEGDPYGFAGKFNIVFAGTMGKAQALDAVLDAAKLVAPKRPEIQFVFVGGGIEVERLKASAASQQLENVRFIPRMPMSEVGALLNAADVLLVHLKDDPLFAITIPSKTQAYMAVGKPILMAVRGDAAALVEQAGAGFVATPQDPVAIAEAACRFAALSREELVAMGSRGAAFYRDHLSVAVNVSKFGEVFERVVAERRQA
ncbi:glycosyltransferase family 4 protein [Pandoraea oxalativorans]|uniref:Glycosyltransferase WbuB n=1 Tax=Pandoraea oxalativorans TaxID=573737 RepID=A0A0E3YAA8_9BURK|nr:glycosyltransferase family 4 protein [Pandoraea oxalativorans]AKC68732.1 glycosyltransferase WbuB [Pandoraea oxalativorans]